jgi:Gpi18-like mannosyltransferase
MLIRQLRWPVLRAFILSRAFILIIFIAVPLLVSHESNGFRELSVDKNGSVTASLRQTVATADARIYASIAERGYDKQAFDKTEHNWAFFPVYPLIVSLFHADFYLAGTVVSNLFFLAALGLLFVVSNMFGLDQDKAGLAVLYAATYPTSYFFSMPFTESLFFCLTLLSVYLALKDWWWLAGAAGAIASATRITGVLLFVLLSILYIQRRGKLIKSDALSLFLVPLGLVAFMVYIWRVTGNPLGVIQAHAAFGRSATPGIFLSPLIGFILHPRAFAGWGFEPLAFAMAILGLFCAYILARWKEWALSAYSLLSVLVPLSTGTLLSIPRLMMVVFPIYIVLAKLRGRQVITFAFTTLLALLTVFCALHYTFAVT